jgi:hypothetical protein
MRAVKEVCRSAPAGGEQRVVIGNIERNMEHETYNWNRAAESNIFVVVGGRHCDGRGDRLWKQRGHEANRRRG